MPIKKRITGKANDFGFDPDSLKPPPPEDPTHPSVATVALRPGMTPDRPLAYMVRMKGHPASYGSKEQCERIAEEWNKS